jgi:hypothetical protein
MAKIRRRKLGNITVAGSGANGFRRPTSVLLKRMRKAAGTAEHSNIKIAGKKIPQCIRSRTSVISLFISSKLSKVYAQHLCNTSPKEILQIQPAASAQTVLNRSAYLPRQSRSACALAKLPLYSYRVGVQSCPNLVFPRGCAGTGKSFALRAVNRGLTEAGHSVVVVTPQRQQALDLAEAGFQDTQTVNELLARQRMPRAAVVLVDARVALSCLVVIL